MAYKSTIALLVVLSAVFFANTRFLMEDKEPIGVEYRRFVGTNSCDGKYEVTSYDKLDFCYRFLIPGTTSLVIKKVADDKIETHHFENNTMCSGDDYTVPISQEIGKCMPLYDDAQIRVFVYDNKDKIHDPKEKMIDA